MRSRLPLLAAFVALAVALIGVGGLAWVIADPQYWFPGAYAEKGDRGDRGPRGPRGLVGPPGPVGPDAEEAIFAIQGDLEDISSRLDELEGGTSATEIQNEIDALQSAIDDICSAIGNTTYTLGTELEELIDSMYAACP